MTKTLQGTYQTEYHVYAVLTRSNHPMIVLDPDLRWYYGRTWDMIDCPYSVQDQWKNLRLQPGERVTITLDNGITSKIEREGTQQ